MTGIHNPPQQEGKKAAIGRYKTLLKQPIDKEICRLIIDWTKRRG